MVVKSLGEKSRLYIEVETSGFKPVVFPIDWYKGSTKCLEIKLPSPHGRKVYMVEGESRLEQSRTPKIYVAV